MTRRLMFLLLLLPAVGAVLGSSGTLDGAEPASSVGIAIRAEKILTVTKGVVDHGVILVRDGKIEAVGPADEVKIPEGYEVLDEDGRWVMPGLIDLHNHSASWSGRDINDMVYQINPELRVLDVVAGESAAMEKAVGAGVTTVLMIPGSGTNLSGFGVLLKTAGEKPEDKILRFPGAMKIAQAGNPERRHGDLGRARMGMNWLIRDIFRQAKEYDDAWTAYETGKTKEAPAKVQRLEMIRKVIRKEVPVLVHTQWVPVIESTVRILCDEFGLRPVLSHATFDSFKAAPIIVERDLPVNTGPRGLWFDRRQKKVIGVAAEWWRRGVRRLSICTDAGVVPQEELVLQAAVAIRLGLPEEAALRAVTIEPALAIGLADRLGSIEVGKDADLITVTGPPFDIRNYVTRVLIGGRVVYDISREPRRF